MFRQNHSLILVYFSPNLYFCHRLLVSMETPFCSKATSKSVPSPPFALLGIKLLQNLPSKYLCECWALLHFPNAKLCHTVTSAQVLHPSPGSPDPYDGPYPLLCRAAQCWIPISQTIIHFQSPHPSTRLHSVKYSRFHSMQMALRLSCSWSYEEPHCLRDCKYFFVIHNCLRTALLQAGQTQSAIVLGLN